VAQYKTIIIPEVVIAKYNTMNSTLKEKIRSQYNIVNSMMGGSPNAAPILYIGDTEALARTSEPEGSTIAAEPTVVVADKGSDVDLEETEHKNNPSSIKSRTSVPDAVATPTAYGAQSVFERYGKIPEYQIQALRSLYRSIK
jgi:hypothetical protein